MKVASKADETVEKKVVKTAVALGTTLAAVKAEKKVGLMVE